MGFVLPRGLQKFEKPLLNPFKIGSRQHHDCFDHIAACNVSVHHSRIFQAIRVYLHLRLWIVSKLQSAFIKTLLNQTLKRGHRGVCPKKLWYLPKPLF